MKILQNVYKLCIFRAALILGIQIKCKKWLLTFSKWKLLQVLICKRHLMAKQITYRYKELYINWNGTYLLLLHKVELTIAIIWALYVLYLLYVFDLPFSSTWNFATSNSGSYSLKAQPWVCYFSIYYIIYNTPYPPQILAFIVICFFFFTLVMNLH